MLLVILPLCFLDLAVILDFGFLPLPLSALFSYLDQHCWPLLCCPICDLSFHVDTVPLYVSPCHALNENVWGAEIREQYIAGSCRCGFSLPSPHPDTLKEKYSLNRKQDKLTSSE